MELTPFFKSVIDQDDQPVVICNRAHTVLYMNPTALRRYEKRGGAALVGRNLLECHGEASAAVIKRVLDWFDQSAAHNRVFAYRIEAENADIYMVALRGEGGEVIGYYEKHEPRTRDTEPFYAALEPAKEKAGCRRGK